MKTLINLKTLLVVNTFLLHFITNAQTLFPLLQDGFSNDNAVLVDYENDGDLDIVVNNIEDDEIVVFFNDASKTFPQISIQSSGINFRINDIKAADLDNDGDFDLVVSSGESPFFGTPDGEIYYLQNNGNDNFTKFLVDLDFHFREIVLEDFTGDGYVDIVGTEHNQTSLYTNSGPYYGSFTFTKSAVDTNSSDDAYVRKHDFNNDGTMDIAIGGTGIVFDDPPVGSRILLNDGLGNFTVSQFLNTTGNYRGVSYDMEITDFDGDAIDDIVAFYTIGTGGLNFLDGSTAFSPTSLKQTSGINCGGEFEIFDIDGNGYKDIVFQEICNNYLGEKQLYAVYQNGPMQFDTTQLDIKNNSSNAKLIQGDMDNDGDIDLISCTRSNAENLSWWENINGKLYRHLISGEIADNKTSKFGDIDGDGDLDVLVCAGELSTNVSSEIILFENIGNDQYVNWLILDDFLKGSSADFVDVDNDGDLDIYASATNGNKIVVLENTGTIYEWNEIVVDELAANPQGIDPIDLNNDGLMDLVSVQFDKIYWYKNNGLGNAFGKILIDPSILELTKIEAADINEDGFMDVVAVSDDNTNSILYYQNPGTNTNFIKTEVITGIEVLDFEIADLNADGNLDIMACVDDYSNPTTLFAVDVIAFYGDGTGSFPATPTILVQVSGNTYSCTTADLDDDGDLDILYGYRGDLMLLDNLGNGTYDIPFEITSVANSSGEITDICVGDSNNDTSKDILFFEQSNFKPYVFTYPGVSCISALNLTGSITANTYLAGNTINATNATIDGNTVFSAGNTVELGIGFETPNNYDFEAIIGGCGNVE